jgi:hypothetical protein
MSVTVDYTKQFNDIITGLGFLDRKLDVIQKNTRTPLFHSQRRIKLVDKTGTKNVWVAINVPFPMKFWTVRANPSTAKLLIGFGTTDNLQETPPLQNYESMAAGEVYERYTAPKLIFLQSDTDDTEAEITIWV